MEDLIILINAGVGIVISLMVSYIPFLAEKFYAIEPEKRGLAMVGVVFVSALAIFGLSCTGLFNYVPCTSGGALGLLKAFLVMVATNQVTYQITPTSPTKARLKSSNL